MKYWTTTIGTIFWSINFDEHMSLMQTGLMFVPDSLEDLGMDKIFELPKRWIIV